MSARAIALVTVLLGVTGLFRPAPGTAQQEGQRGQAALTVQNHAPASVRVYVLQAGHMVPAGTVDAGADEALSIPPAFLESDEPIRLLAERIGGDSWYESDPVRIRSSSRVSLSVAEAIERSSVSVDG
jgi:hypothetical protein